MKALLAFLFLGLLAVQAAPVAGIDRKLQTIIIPQVRFDDISLPEAIEFLRQKAVALDPDKTGFNVVIHVPKDDPALQSKVTLSLSNVPVGVALDYTTRMAKLRFKVDAFAVVILPLAN